MPGTVPSLPVAPMSTGLGTALGRGFSQVWPRNSPGSLGFPWRLLRKRDNADAVCRLARCSASRRSPALLAPALTGRIWAERRRSSTLAAYV